MIGTSGPNKEGARPGDTRATGRIKSRCFETLNAETLNASLEDEHQQPTRRSGAARRNDLSWETKMSGRQRVNRPVQALAVAAVFGFALTLTGAAFAQPVEEAAPPPPGFNAAPPPPPGNGGTPASHPSRRTGRSGREGGIRRSGQALFALPPGRQADGARASVEEFRQRAEARRNRGQPAFHPAGQSFRIEAVQADRRQGNALRRRI